MPQLDIGIYFIQIFSNLSIFWFLYFYTNNFILSKVSNILKIKTFFFLNNDFNYLNSSIFFNYIELNYYKNILWLNFHNISIFFKFFKDKLTHLYMYSYIKNIAKFINLFNNLTLHSLNMGLTLFSNNTIN